VKGVVHLLPLLLAGTVVVGTSATAAGAQTDGATAPAASIAAGEVQIGEGIRVERPTEQTLESTAPEAETTSESAPPSDADHGMASDAAVSTSESSPPDARSEVGDPVPYPPTAPALDFPIDSSAALDAAIEPDPRTSTAERVVVREVVLDVSPVSSTASYGVDDVLPILSVVTIGLALLVVAEMRKRRRVRGA